MTDDDAGGSGRGGKNGNFWMTSFVNDPLFTSSSGTTLQDLLTKTNTTSSPHFTHNVIFELYCYDCTGTFNRS